ncbi:MAG: hypothetical protein AABW50_01180 [Nanoarchaeota archaeon]
MSNQPDIRNEKEYYLVGSQKLRKERGRGKALSYLLEHKGESVSLDEIKKETNWKSTNIQMNGLSSFINTFSGYYQMNRIHSKEGISYILTTKREISERKMRKRIRSQLRRILPNN